MAASPSIPDAGSIPDYITDGARIAAILFVWTIIGAFVTWLTTDVLRVGSLFRTLGPGLGGVFVVTGFLNAVLYVLYRAIDYWQAH